MGGTGGEPPMCAWNVDTDSCGISDQMERTLNLMIQFSDAPADSMCTEGDMLLMFNARDSEIEAMMFSGSITPGCGGCVMRALPDEDGDHGDEDDDDDDDATPPTLEDIQAICPVQVAACQGSDVCNQEMTMALSNPGYDPTSQTQSPEAEDLVYCIGLEEIRGHPDLGPCVPRPPAPPPPPPVVVQVDVVEYTVEEASAAKATLAAALTGPAADASSDTPPPPPAPVVIVAATVGFPVAITAIAEGTPARTEFEADFKDSMAVSIGLCSSPCDAATANTITVDAVTGARRRLNAARRMQSGGVNVDFSLEAPATVQTEAASLVAAVDTASISIDVGGVPVQAIDAPLTPVVTAPADVDCVGAWDECSADCSDKVYRIQTVASGSGTACEAEHYDAASCAPGDGQCPAVSCEGSWSACAADCGDKTYTVSTPASGGEACPATDGATAVCAPGEGDCPLAPVAAAAASPAPASSGATTTGVAVAFSGTQRISPATP